MRVVLSPRAYRDLQRLDEFLRTKSPSAAMAATTAIRHGLEEMLTFPAAGRPVEDVEPDTRDWLVPFGTGGYVIRYLQQPGQLLIVGIRHMREAGFDESDGP